MVFAGFIDQHHSQIMNGVKSVKWVKGRVNLEAQLLFMDPIIN
jgi:hypothetical protein